MEAGDWKGTSASVAKYREPKREEKFTQVEPRAAYSARDDAQTALRDTTAATSSAPHDLKDWEMKASESDTEPTRQKTQAARKVALISQVKVEGSGLVDTLQVAGGRKLNAEREQTKPRAALARAAPPFTGKTIVPTSAVLEDPCLDVCDIDGPSSIREHFKAGLTARSGSLTMPPAIKVYILVTLGLDPCDYGGQEVRQHLWQPQVYWSQMPNAHLGCPAVALRMDVPVYFKASPAHVPRSSAALVAINTATVSPSLQLNTSKDAPPTSVAKRPVLVSQSNTASRKASNCQTKLTPSPPETLRALASAIRARGESAAQRCHLDFLKPPPPRGGIQVGPSRHCDVNGYAPLNYEYLTIRGRTGLHLARIPLDLGAGWKIRIPPRGLLCRALAAECDELLELLSDSSEPELELSESQELLLELLLGVLGGP
ncbi:hypothetical protein B0H14DRAFT_2563902 [Mycena olivaceomarginata]|nr:hypothetical protein B0H14DRAFT_2563902 [Mycena olivaceomarginata]